MTTPLLYSIFVLTGLLNKLDSNRHKEEITMNGKHSPLSKDTEQAILLAAEQEFMSRGYEGAKTVTIAHNAGVTHAMLHYYFGTKERLFNKIFNEKIALLSKMVTDVIFKPDMTPLEKITAVVDRHFEFLVRHPDLPRFLLNELAHNTGRRRLMEHKLRFAWSKVLPPLQRDWDKMIVEEGMKPISMVDFIMDVVSLNLFVFLALPVLDVIIENYYGSREAFFEARKRENVKIIMQRLLQNNNAYE